MNEAAMRYSPVMTLSDGSTVTLQHVRKVIS